MFAAIYASKSTDQTGVSEADKSVARQVEHARSYAAAKGWTVAADHVYVDDGISGAEFATRPGFLRLLVQQRVPLPVVQRRGTGRRRTTCSASTPKPRRPISSKPSVSQ